MKEYRIKKVGYDSEKIIFIIKDDNLINGVEWAYELTICDDGKPHIKKIKGKGGIKND